MTTQNNNDADNEVPPVARMFGLAVSEWVTYSFIALTLGAVIFGSIVGGERDAQAERAMATLDALTEAAENRSAAGSALICDDTLLDPQLLANDYLTLRVRPAPIDEKNESLGYGPALYVSVVEKEVSGDTWDTAKRLKGLVEEVGKKEVEAREALSGRIIAANVSTDEDEADEDDQKPENRLRKVREVKKTGYAGDEVYLQYYILASEVAICNQGA